jgi:hypothetical protein
MCQAELPSEIWRPQGFQPTLRHSMILVAHCALVFSVLGPFIEPASPVAVRDAALAGVLATPWGLAVLVLLFDRRGPLKFWLAPFLFFLFAPLLAACYDGVALIEWAEHGTMPNPAVVLVVNAVCLGSFGLYVKKQGPTACPNCARKALIPWMSLHGQSPRFSRTRWCASCGSRYWRKPGGPWRPEQRETTL